MIPSKQDAIKSFLINELKNGGKVSKDIFTKAQSNGFAQSTMYEAIKTFGILTVKDKGITSLRLPSSLKPIIAEPSKDVKQSI
jgi:hypothetical protein